MGIASDERCKIILELLQKHGSVKTDDLITRFQVSGETIRRDLAFLDAAGQLTKVHGGATSGDFGFSAPRYVDRKALHIDEKIEIAEAACDFVQEGMSIALDISTTNLEVAKAIKKKFSQLTILTNSLAIATELSDAKSFDIIIPGGRLLGDQLAVVGDMCLANMRQYNVDLYFVSANGVSLENGITDFGIVEVEAKKVMAEIAQRRILVAVSTIFNEISLVKVADLSSVECIITDSRLDDGILQNFARNGVRIIRAGS
ncbi:MAG: DeoR/GlpR family DNA-binding transcription regulator [Spirochaetes bacterium]|nr:DeoR/GlpR family DNA-binding transcription regulator [Spirochaetota bacterium]